jgi:RNA polymerase sigma-70 factor (ECF subfamily)
MAGVDKLIRQCQKKSSKAFDDLYRLYSPFIYGICLRYTKNKQEAEDLMQECYIKVLNKITDYEFKGSFEGWLRRLTINNVINYLKARNKFLTEDIDDYKSGVESSESDIVSNMSAEEIISIINQLPVGYRTVFNLYVVEGYKHNEIAEILNISENTSRTQLKKARTALIKMILERNGERF